MLALALLLAAPAGALAAGGAVKKDVGKGPDEIREYWTAERLKDARPRERGRGGTPGKPKPTAPSGWSTTAVDWSAAPAETVTNGKVYFTENGQNYVCSGTAVQSRNESVVWTAGHCVHGGEGGAYVSNWAFRPAHASGRTFPLFAASSLTTSAGWIGGDYARDVGAATVAPVDGVTLTDTLAAARPISFSTTLATGARVRSFGYPAASPYSGQTLYVCDSYISRRDTSVSPADYGIPCSMTGGSSGGGWLDAGGQLVSVNSYGYGSLRDVMFGPVLDATAGTVFAAAGG